MSLKDKKLSLIGAGVMGEAMIKGLLKQDMIAPENIIAADIHVDRGALLEQEYGLKFTTDNVEAAEAADLLILSVKPQVMDIVLDGINNRIKPDTLVLSIAAGYKLDKIVDGCGNKHAVRAMPNTPGQIGQGITAWTDTEAVNDEQRKLAEIVLGALGETLYVSNEQFMDMATALNGSGPAYVFLLMEAMVDAGVHLGFSRRDAERLVQQTMLGSVNYAIESGLHPAELRNQVTSSGGTTASALYQLEKGGVRTVISRAIWAAYKRSVELGTEDAEPHK